MKSTTKSNRKESFYELSEYSEENLIKSFIYKDHISESEILKMNKRHVDLFKDYLGDKKNDSLNAKTIIRENRYLSSSYLNDYANFYNTSYSTYRRFCLRVHFFSKSISISEFDEIIYSPDEKRDEIFWQSYLGYIVIRPLPKAIFGATLLKTYKSNTNYIYGRKFPSIRKYSINLFGKKLEIDSLIYQEQDSIVGMCASNALWTSLHKVCMPNMFHRQLPNSVSETTKFVKNPFDGDKGRQFPNSGLTTLQICEVIGSVGLVTEVRTALETNEFSINLLHNLKSFVYSYLKMGIPVLLGLEMDGDWHLVTIAGYNFSSKPILSRSMDFEKNLYSQRIDKFYIHDDQVGPFSRMAFNEKENKLITAWKCDNGIEECLMEAKVVSVFVPIHEQVRIRYEDIAEKVLFLNEILSTFLPNGTVFNWEIYLDFLNNYREELFNNPAISKKIKEKVISQSHPKFIWIVKGYIFEDCVIEFIFDATNIPDAEYCRIINIYNDSLISQIRQHVTKRKSYFFDSLIEHLGKKIHDLFKYELK